MSTNTASFRWDVPPSALARNVGDYGKRVIAALHQLADFFAAKLEAYAKQAAPWTDRTGHARQSLTGLAVKAATGIVIYLASLAEYGIFLEVKQAGKYAVILPTMEAHHGEIMAACRRLVGA